MKKQILSLLVFAGLIFGAVAQTPNDWANFGRFEQANREISQRPAAVIMGNSITEGWGHKRPDFFKTHNYVSRGISGQTTSQMLVRFRADVLNLHPLVAVIAGGTNDIAQNTGYITLPHILDNIVSMVELARANGIVPVLCSVPPARDFSWRRGLEPAAKIMELNTMIRAYAEKNGILYVDYHAALTDPDGGMKSEYTQDGVHPTEAGYEVMERILPPVIEQALKQQKKAARRMKNNF